MKILVLSFYYAPDLSAGSFRTTALIDALMKLRQTGLEVDVLTTSPNRYGSFDSDAPESEQYEGLTIRRIALPRHTSDVAGQARAFGVFARGVLAELRGRRYDLVFGTSSRLMTAALAAVAARRCGARLYLDVRDIFTDTIGDVFPSSYSWALKSVFQHLEGWTVRSADKVNLVSKGFRDYFAARYPEVPLGFVSNGIDPEFLASADAEDTARAVPAGHYAGPIRVVYAGNIGEGQGLHVVLPGIARRLAGRATFRIIGDGGRRAQLESALAQAGCDNVDLVAPVPRIRLIEEYRSADVLFLHLNDYDAFRKVLPSKLFEYAALGKPVWAGVAGYAADFIHEEIENAAVFAPCDAAAAVESFDTLRLLHTPRRAFVARYRREKLMEDLVRDVLAVATGPARRVAGRAVPSR